MASSTFRVVTVRLFQVAMAPVSHLFPFRTEKLSPDAPMVLPNPRESRSPPFFESPAAREIRCGALFCVCREESAGASLWLRFSAAALRGCSGRHEWRPYDHVSKQWVCDGVPGVRGDAFTVSCVVVFRYY